MPLEIYPELTAQQAKEDRKHLRVWVGRVLVLLALAAWTIYVTKAYAEEIPVYVSEQQGIVVRLMAGPCVEPLSQQIVMSGPPQHVAKFKAIDSEWPMKDGTRKKFAGCWALLTAEEAGAMEDVFVLVFEDGMVGGVLKSEFLKKAGDTGA